jgi:hypothetical protein
MEPVTVPVGVVEAAEVMVAAIVVEAGATVVVVTVPTHQAGVRITTATAAGNVVTELVSAEVSSPRRRSRPIRPKRSPASCLWSSTLLTRTIQICPMIAAHQKGWTSPES